MDETVLPAAEENRIKRRDNERRTDMVVDGAGLKTMRVFTGREPSPKKVRLNEEQARKFAEAEEC